jgi:hypothetical protein
VRTGGFWCVGAASRALFRRRHETSLDLRLAGVGSMTSGGGL